MAIDGPVLHIVPSQEALARYKIFKKVIETEASSIN